MEKYIQSIRQILIKSDNIQNSMYEFPDIAKIMRNNKSIGSSNNRLIYKTHIVHYDSNKEKSYKIKCIAKLCVDSTTESSILINLQHDNIIKVFGIVDIMYKSKPSCIIFSEIMDGNLHDYIFTNIMVEYDIRHIFKQMARAVAYCHRRRIIHCDIKLDNFLINRDKHVRLCDFGLSEKNNGFVIDKIKGTPYYMARETLLYHSISYASDVWSLGICLYVMTCHKYPFDADNLDELKATLRLSFYKITNPKLSEDVKDLIHQLLDVHLETRLSASQIFSHTWFTVILPPKKLHIFNKNYTIGRLHYSWEI